MKTIFSSRVAELIKIFTAGIVLALLGTTVAINAYSLYLMSPFASKIESEIELEPGIFLVNLKGEPEWNKDDIKTVRAIVSFLPQSFKATIIRIFPLKIGLVVLDIHNAAGQYKPGTNTIILYKYYNKDPAVMTKNLFHEFGHAFDYNYNFWGIKPWSLIFPFSSTVWQQYLESQEFPDKLKNELLSLNLRESFATAISRYFYSRYSPNSILNNNLPEEVAFWFQKSVG